RPTIRSPGRSPAIAAGVSGFTSRIRAPSPGTGGMSASAVGGGSVVVTDDDPGPPPAPRHDPAPSDAGANDGLRAGVQPVGSTSAIGLSETGSFSRTTPR